MISMSEKKYAVYIFDNIVLIIFNVALFVASFPNIVNDW